MSRKIAIRKENIDLTEKRAPLSPNHVGRLVKEHNITVMVESWPNRHFPDQQFKENGAFISSQLEDANLILGVKEVPLDDLIEKKAFCFFSHTIKGQSYNMPLLRKILDLNVTLMDYERVTDDKDRRLIFFGPYAGLAGAINGLWLLGRRLDCENIDNPFSLINQARSYKNLGEAKKAVQRCADQIKENGLPDTGKPWTIAITGNGTVSHGVQEIIDLLPVKNVTPEEFRKLQKDKSFDMTALYKVVIDCDNFVKTKDPKGEFGWDDYFAHPEKYEADFARYLPDITLLVNAIFWDKMYPRLVTKEDIAALWEKDDQPDLRVIADITCDPEGSIECTLKTTTSENPAYVFHPESEDLDYGVKGRGPVVLAVDKLPSELPEEATNFFADALLPFVPGLAATDFTKPFEELDMPVEFKRAVIAHQGELTPDFEYLYQFLQGY